MAVDTKAKRSSVVNIAAWSTMLPPPDASMDQADRQQVAVRYRGILAVSNILAAYPNPFAATSSATLDPFAATSAYKGA